MLSTTCGSSYSVSGSQSSKARSLERGTKASTLDVSMPYQNTVPNSSTNLKNWMLCCTLITDLIQISKPTPFPPAFPPFHTQFTTNTDNQQTNPAGKAYLLVASRGTVFGSRLGSNVVLASCEASLFWDLHPTPPISRIRCLGRFCRWGLPRLKGWLWLLQRLGVSSAEAKIPDRKYRKYQTTPGSCGAESRLLTIR